MREFYEASKHLVISSGFGPEIAWCEELRVDDVEPSDVFREAAWVVLNSGFRERIARKFFPDIALCFCDWDVEDAVAAEAACVLSASAIFRNKRKIESIAMIAAILSGLDAQLIREKLRNEPIEWLSRLPYIGPVTAWHLARNLGVDVAKADRHLVRAAEAHGFSCVQEFCGSISTISGDPIRVVDIVIWRSAEIRAQGNHPAALMAA